MVCTCVIFSSSPLSCDYPDFSLVVSFYHKSWACKRITQSFHLAPNQILRNFGYKLFFYGLSCGKFALFLSLFSFFFYRLSIIVVSATTHMMDYRRRLHDINVNLLWRANSSNRFVTVDPSYSAFSPYILIE